MNKLMTKCNRLKNEIAIYNNYKLYLDNENISYYFRKISYDIYLVKKYVLNIECLQNYDYDIVNITILYNNKKYTIKLDFRMYEYPWSPPQIDILYKSKKINYKDFLKNSWNCYRKIFNNYPEINKLKSLNFCFCCKSIICKNEWESSYNIFVIIKMVILDLNRNQKYNEIFLLYKIKKKYLGYDLNIIDKYLHK